MAFCANCGHQLENGAKFCYECGAKISAHTVSQEERRRIVYDGEIHKCPNCGETIGSFETNCSACGFEIRGVGSASAIKELVEKIERINARTISHKRDEDEKKRFEKKKKHDKAELIVNYPISNTKEDMLEFMILASSNIDVKKSVFNDCVTKAWIGKMDQVYEKAQLSMQKTADFERLKSIYENKMREVRRKRKLMGIISAGIVLALISLIVISIVGIVNLAKNRFETLTIKGVSMEIAKYWEEGDSENECLHYEYYSDVMLDIAFHEESDPNYDVNFDGLYSDNENMIKALEDKYEEANVLSHKVFESDYGVKGILYEFTLSQSTGWFTEESAKGYCFCFPSENDRRWYYVTMIKLNSAEGNRFEEDYMKTIASIKVD